MGRFKLYFDVGFWISHLASEHCLGFSSYLEEISNYRIELRHLVMTRDTDISSRLPAQSRLNYYMRPVGYESDLGGILDQDC